ncbi:restriction endonuclease subunit S [Mesorhizobium sp. M0871]|uniref:restriction endonuclease subunit S n=1 Tax=Mesorhizobium sp. M0871 TaxID=2957017 RepID=UPI003335CBE4
MTGISALLIEHLNLWTSAIAGKSTAGRGRSKKFSLHGIDKLRALILDLAVRGKLFPQDPADEPASEFLENLGFAAKPNVMSCPLGWAMAPLTAFGEFFGGVTPSKGKESYWGPGLPWVSPKDMGVERIQETEDEVTEQALKETGLKEIPPGSLLMVARSGILRRKFPVAINEVRCTTNQDMKSLVLKSNVEPRYLQIMLIGHQPRILKDLVKRGMTVESLIFDEFTKALWPIPPLREQKRIIAKVDELMALCERLEAGTYKAIEAHQLLVTELLATLKASRDAKELADNWARIEAHFDTLFVTEDSVDELKQTILQLAVMGRLVPQDPKDEPASELLKKVKVEKAKLVLRRMINKPKLLPSIEDNEKPFTLPKGWMWARFPEVGIFERGKSRHRPRDDPKLFNPGLYPLVQTGEVARANEIINEFHSEYSEEGLEQSKMWPKGTMCITIAANIADTAILGFDACFPDSVVGFIPFAPISNPRFFLHFMKTAKADLLRFAPSTAQKNINLSILESVLVPIPPLEEMERIVGKIDELSAYCNSLKASIRESGATSLTLADAIVAKAVG